jgi:hypothetical protein
MNPQKKSQNNSLLIRTGEIIKNASANLSKDSATQRLTITGKRLSTIPVLKLNFADPSAGATVTNHASHSSHASHASHHSRHR